MFIIMYGYNTVIYIKDSIVIIHVCFQQFEKFIAKLVFISQTTNALKGFRCIIAHFETDFAYFENMRCSFLVHIAHPGCHGLSHALLEGETEGAVTPIATVAGQLLRSVGLLGCNGLTVVADEVLNAEVVDIGIVGDALSGEIAAEIEAVGTNGLGKLRKGQVVLQVELRIDAMPL